MKIAAQMYSIRKYTEENGYGASLKELARIGFKAVEHACGFGEFDGKPEELRKFMDDLGISMIGTHLGAAQFLDPAIREQTVEFYSKLGAKFLICPGDQRAVDPAQAAQFGEDLSKAAEFLKPYGMKCGYHNHCGEFDNKDANGKSAWEIMAENSSSDVVLQLDCGWSTVAGRCPCCMIRQVPGRSNSLHFKPSLTKRDEETKLSIIGSDSVEWANVIRAANEVGGTEVFVIEQEWYLPGKTDMYSIEESFKGLAKFL